MQEKQVEKKWKGSSRDDAQGVMYVHNGNLINIYKLRHETHPRITIRKYNP